MAISVFDLFKVGIGPSSSHTVGPMRAARMFVVQVQQRDLMPRLARLRCSLHGSLGATGLGHASDKAVLLGWMGHTPDTVEVAKIPSWVEEVRQQEALVVLGEHRIALRIDEAIRLQADAPLPWHPNGMCFEAWDAQGHPLAREVYYSVGGGFVLSQQAADDEARQGHIAPGPQVLPLPFHSAAELLRLCQTHRCSIADVMRRNETHWRTPTAIDHDVLALWSVMQACAQRGCTQEGCLPGPFRVPRRAPALYRRLTERAPANDPLFVMDWVNLIALAVNEENAAGGRVVTAPTNGAAGIIPAVLHYYRRFVPDAHDDGVVDFLLTAGAIGLLYKENASISGAEVGCQGEVGVACSMAAAGLCAVMGGSPAQVENAAEIGMEHHLGLTCDPVGGLVQIPCIERNAVAAVKAINAARLALHGNGEHRVSLDQVICTMRQTGADMQDKYKETSRGGLAVNIVAC